MLDIVSKAKKIHQEARAKSGGNQVPNTKPSHALVDYAGAYEHPAYGVLNIGLADEQLQYVFREATLALNHFHYDRFDTPNDEIHGQWSVNFITNPLGDIERAVMSLDESEAVFVRLPEKLDDDLLKQLVGTYQTATGYKFQVNLKEGELWLEHPQAPKDKLIPYKELQFRVPQFSDTVYEFISVGGEIKLLKQTQPYGEFVFTKALMCR